MPTETTETPTQQETLPEFPKLTGPLGEFVDAITDDIPYEHRALTALTYVGIAVSGLTKFSGYDYDQLQPRFYACLIGPPSSGKSAAMKEVKRWMESIPAINNLNTVENADLRKRLFEGQAPDLGRVHVQESINSGPALVMALQRHPRMVLMPDEGSGAFEKFKSGRALSDLLRLLEDNKIGHAVRDKETVVKNAHFGLVIGAPPSVFTEMWSGTRGAGSGLQSRFVLSFSEKKMPQIPNGTVKEVAQKAAARLRDALFGAPELIDLPDTKGDFTRGLTEGLDADHMARAVDMGRRFALLMAACNGKKKMDKETIQLGRQFIQYQIAMFARFMPDDAWSPVQRFENRIIAFFKRFPCPKGCNPCTNECGHTERELLINIKPENSPGGREAFKKAFAILTADLAYEDEKFSWRGHSGELLRGERTGKWHHGLHLWRLNPDREPRPTVPTPSTTTEKVCDPDPTLPTDVKKESDGIPFDPDEI